MNIASIQYLGKLSRLAKRVPGAVLLLEHVRRGFSHSEKIITINDFDGNLTIDLHLNEHMQSQIFWYGYYSRDIILALDKILSSGMVVIDIGANIGEITLCAAKRVGIDGRVYSFEPMPKLYESLRKNITSNRFFQVNPIRMGVADKDGVMSIYCADSNFSDGTIHEGLGTLYPMNNRNTPAGKIQVITLDKFFEEAPVDRLDFIKIDVEGAEFDVLKGAEKTITQYKPRLIIEIQQETAGASGSRPEEMLDYLKQLGYEPYTIGRKARLIPLSAANLKPFQNVLFIPK